MNTFIKTLILLVIVAIMISCSNKPTYNPLEIYSEEQLQTLKLELVQIMGQRPKNVNRENARNPEFQKYYHDLAAEYEFLYLAQKSDTNYYYMIRPARNHSGKVNRGVGGYYFLNENDSVTGFVEVFNTTIQPVDELNNKGLLLFESMVLHGNIDQYFNDRDLIEWPSSRSVYDKTINEWVYIND